MPKLLLGVGALVVGSLILPAAFWIGSLVVPPNQLAARAGDEWSWSSEKATLAYSVDQHLPPNYEVGLADDGDYVFRTKFGQRRLCCLKWRGQRVVFTRWNDTLFIAEFEPHGSGCEVQAIDLATGTQYWRSQLIGSRQRPMSYKQNHSNSVNIDTDGVRIIIYGNESTSRYVEHLDINTGKTLLNKKFEPLR